nr:LacI family DNA-binding transcriptional regulator [Microbacterium halimionae]
MLDVARHAGVSHQTVSRYLAFSGGLKPQTSARIDAAIRALDYHPNLAARSMRTRRSGRLTVVLPPLVFNPARLLAGATAAAHEAGYTVDVLSLDDTSHARESRVVEVANSGQVEGILSFAPITRHSRAYERTPLVVSPDFDGEMRGTGDLAEATPIVEFMTTLASQGHRQFLHIAGDLDFASARARRETFLHTAESLALAQADVADGDWSGRSGLDAIRALSTRDHPTAVIASNDHAAAGAMRGALDRGWRIPEDISITGWDNSSMGRYLARSLTTVHVDLEGLGRASMQRLVAKVGGNAADQTAATDLHRVIWRESTAHAAS